MASKFKIFMHQNSDNLHLKLSGDFNDISVCELIEVLKRNCSNVNKAIIHTGSLDNVRLSMLGRDIFYKNLDDLDSGVMDVTFTGDRASKLAPQFTAHMQYG